MKQFILFFFFVFIGSVIYSQEVVVVIEVTDKKYFDPIQNVNVNVSVKDSIVNYTTNTKGLFAFKVNKGEEMQLRFSHHSYLGFSINKKISQKIKGDTLFLSYQMEFIRTQSLIGTVIKPPGVPEVVFKSSQIHVADFEIQNDGNLVLLTYPKRLKKGSSLMFMSGSDIISSFQVPDVSKELIRDYRGNTHIVCEQNVYGVNVGKSEIGITILPKDYFFKYIAPIVDTAQTKMFFSTFNPDYPAFEYFSYDQKDSTYSKIMEIEDELMMELYRSEYKWVDVRTKLWAKTKELNTGVDAEIWVGANFFTQSIYYKELYAPLFYKNDSVFVFDYYKDKLFTYDVAGEVLDSVEIFHHYDPRSTGWQKNLIQDRATGEVYAVYDRSGYSYIGHIDLKTGEINEQIKLNYRYVDKIEIYNNSVYYIYRPFESAQKKYLYKERMPYDFGKIKVIKEN